jgi:hypothetical protein
MIGFTTAILLHCLLESIKFKQKKQVCIVVNNQRLIEMCIDNLKRISGSTYFYSFFEYVKLSNLEIEFKTPHHFLRDKKYDCMIFDNIIFDKNNILYDINAYGIKTMLFYNGNYNIDFSMLPQSENYRLFYV